MRRIKTTLFIATLFVASCAKEATLEGGDIESLFTKERTLTQTSQTVISEPLSHVGLVDIIEDKAILQNMGQNSGFNFYVVDVKSGEVLNRLFGVGRGRNELMYPTYMGVSDGRIYLYDVMNQQVISIATNDLLTRSPELRPQKIESISTSGRYIAQRYTPLSGGRFILAKSEEEENDPKLTMLSIDDGQFFEEETFDRLGEGVDDEHKHYTYGGQITTTDDNKNMIYRTRGGVYLRFYDCSNTATPPKMIKEYVAQIPEYNIRQEGSVDRPVIMLTQGPETIMGFYSVSADDDNYYMNYSSVTYSEYLELRRQKSEYRTTTILVFSKKGEPKEKLIIEDCKLFAAIHHCEIDNSLYYLDYDQDGNDCLMRYKL
ncbi:MAG: BF3164 family lipoprotein [Rikenellaceae bacterium]